MPLFKSYSAIFTQILYYFTACNFNRVVEAVQQIAKLHTNKEGTMSMEIPSYAIQTGNHLKRVANVILGIAIRHNDKQSRDGNCLF